MGRGRAKAKQTKVARQLKYYTPETDLSALERETAPRVFWCGPRRHVAADEDDYDEYGKWAAGER